MRIEVHHWTDRSKEAVADRNHLRHKIRDGFEKPRARCVEFDCTPEQLRADAERNPQEYFQCRCGSGPWHITWGGICPDCSGAD